MKKRVVTLLVVMLLSNTAMAADPSSLRSVVALALEHAPSLQAAEAARDAAAEDLILGRAWLLPYVIANGSVNQVIQDFKYNKPISFLLTNIRNDEQSYGIKAYQPLFDIKKWATYQQGKISAATGRVKLALQRQRTTLETAAAWLDVIRAKAAYAAAVANERAISHLAKQAKAAFEVGTAAVNDSLTASSRRDLAKAARIRASQVLAQA
ncbi:MAG: TolC family protein, partial [Mariprofundales bacterium]|nr:TolC family protein [Mariprofundales bacterium]